MKSITIILLINLCLITSCIAQGEPPKNDNSYKITNEDNYTYYKSKTKNKSLIIVFHDWFGISDLSFETMDKITAYNHDVLLIDLYQGKSAKTNAEAGQLMNSIKQDKIWAFIDSVFDTHKANYEHIYLWGFSLGTLPASETAIKHHNDVDGLVLFYGNVTNNEEKLKKLNFPSLMIMGGKDNPNGAMNYFNALNKINGKASLFVYPNVGHAFAQKLFNGGANYNEQAKNISFNLALDFLKDISL